MIDNKGYLKIIDFGISKFFNQKELSTNTICGTTDYMAPEIMLGAGYDKSVDWWAVGIILYQLMFGANPYNLLSEDLSPEEFKERIETLDLVFPNSDKYGLEYAHEFKDLIS